MLQARRSKPRYYSLTRAGKQDHKCSSCNKKISKLVNKLMRITGNNNKKS
ncbi:hypothetical protein Hanom_Chr03g00191551 [Helianthus anomalus]